MEDQALAHSREQGSSLKRPPAGSLSRCRPSTPLSHRRSHRGHRNSTDYETIWMDVLEIVKSKSYYYKETFSVSRDCFYPTVSGVILCRHYRSENSRFKTRSLTRR